MTSRSTGTEHAAPGGHRARLSRDEELETTPPAVVTAVALGCAPLPFLAVYAVIFLVHGSVHPVDPPDVTGSTRGEFLAGVIALILFVALSTALLRLLNGVRRWPFVVLELALVGACAYTFVDRTLGGRAVAGVVGVATLVAVVASFAPSSWEHLGRAAPAWSHLLWRGRRPARTAEGRHVGTGDGAGA